LRLRVAWATDPGLEREENEDAVVVWRNKAGLDTLLVVCDGMGGHAAGQTASSIASKTITRVLAEDGDEGPTRRSAEAACKQANSAVYEASEENPEWKGGQHRRGGGDQGIGARAHERRRQPGLPLFRNGSAKLISQDHSWPSRAGPSAWRHQTGEAAGHR
jgi:hypothetical protein